MTATAWICAGQMVLWGTWTAITAAPHTTAPIPATVAAVMTRRRMTTADAIAALLIAKESSGLSKKYLTGLRQYLTAFSKSMPPQLDAITTGHIELWFTSRREKPSTRASNIGRLSALFSFAVRRGWLDKSPMVALDKVRVPMRVPAILSNVEAQQLLDACPPDFLPYVALCLFCGVRPDEAQRLRAGDILLDRRLIRIGPDVSKVGCQRFAVIPDNAVPMLADLPKLSRTTIRRRKRRLARAMGWKSWPQDILRHTAISNWVALTGDIGKVATAMGNSPRIIQRHYHQLVDAQAAKVFFTITQKSCIISQNNINLSQ